MKRNAYTLFYAAAVGITCALVLTAWGHYVRPYRRANELGEKEMNILRVLGVPFEQTASLPQIHETFRTLKEKNTIREDRVDGLTFYIYETSDGEGAVAVPFAGAGLWGPVRGFLALEPDMRTIRDISFYKQEETPGLGGEIATAAFQNRFKGTSIVGPKGQPGIRIVSQGEPSAENEVDAITGATMTSNRVEQMINRTIRVIVEEVDQDVR
mgnify:CR=1 FL=1